MRENYKSSLAASQYRYDIEEYLDDPVTAFTYPVFDSFGDDRQLAGVLATNINWKLFFTKILPHSASGIVCILENSYKQTLAYRIDGPDVTYLGDEDLHDTDMIPWKNLLISTLMFKAKQDPKPDPTRRYR
jgi:hypothetical protein